MMRVIGLIGIGGSLPAAAAPAPSSDLVRRLFVRDLESRGALFVQALKDGWRVDGVLAGKGRHRRVQRSNSVVLDIIAKGDAVFFCKPGTRKDVLMKYGIMEEFMCRGPYHRLTRKVDDHFMAWCAAIEKDASDLGVDVHPWWRIKNEPTAMAMVGNRRVDWHEGQWYNNGDLVTPAELFRS